MFHFHTQSGHTVCFQCKHFFNMLVLKFRTVYAAKNVFFLLQSLAEIFEAYSAENRRDDF